MEIDTCVPELEDTMILRKSKSYMKDNHLCGKENIYFQNSSPKLTAFEIGEDLYVPISFDKEYQLQVPTLDKRLCTHPSLNSISPSTLVDLINGLDEILVIDC